MGINEYFMDHVHSAIRRQTKVSDMDEQIREKVHSIFGSSERQANWCSTKTLSKNFLFSRQQQRTSTARQHLFWPLSSFKLLQTKMQPPSCPGNQVKGEIALFCLKPMKSYILPDGFNFNPQPDPYKRCDSPSCHESSEATWELFEGWWHSSHSSCLEETKTYLIYKDGLHKNLPSLAKTANEAFLQRSQEDPNDDYQEDADVSEEGNTNSDDDHEIHVVGEVNLDAILKHLRRQTCSLHILQQSIKSDLLTTQHQF